MKLICNLNLTLLPINTFTYFKSTLSSKKLILKVFGIIVLVYKINILQKYFILPLTLYKNLYRIFDFLWNLFTKNRNLCSCQNQLSSTMPSANPNSCDADKMRIKLLNRMCWHTSLFLWCFEKCQTQYGLFFILVHTYDIAIYMTFFSEFFYNPKEKVIIT